MKIKLNNLKNPIYIALGLLTFVSTSVGASSWHENHQISQSNEPMIVAQNINPTIAGDPNLFGVWFYVESSNTVNGTGVYQEKMSFLANGELQVFDPIWSVEGVRKGTSGLVVDRGQWAVQNQQIYTRRSLNEPWTMIASQYQVGDGAMLVTNPDRSGQKLWTRN